MMLAQRGRKLIPPIRKSDWKERDGKTKTHQDEKPCPSGSPSNAVHLDDRRGKQTRKGRRESCGGKHNRRAIVPVNTAYMQTHTLRAYRS